MTENTHTTPPFIALKCPTCGAGLHIASKMNQFACDHCGNRYLLDRKLEELSEPERDHLKPNVTYTQHIKQWLRVGEYDVFIHNIHMETVQKERVLYIEVAYRNETNGTLNCRHDQWIIFDREGYTYEPVKDYDFRAVYEGNDKRYVGLSRVIRPGMRLRGWLGFVLPAKAVLEYLQFSGGVPAKTLEIELHLEKS
jgi:DNA-directed RNA polymerase subunit RPC12/RpoP